MPPAGPPRRLLGMALLKFDPQHALAGMRAIKAVVSTEGPMLDVQRTAMQLAQQYVLHVEADIDALAPIAPEELAQVFTDPAERRQLVQVMCGYVMLGQQLTPPYLAAIRRYARALDIDDPAVDQLHYLMDDHITWLKFDFRRRGLIGDVIKQAYRDDGLRGAARTVMQIVGHHEDPALAARFDALGHLPEGTTGRALWRFYTDRGFVFPGHKHGTPLPLVTHDLVHVLTGHDTDVLGEVRTLAFQSGFKRDKPLMFLFLLLYATHLGVDMVALAPGVSSMRDFFARPGVLAEVFQAYARGAAMTVDLLDGRFDVWSVLDLPLAEVRARFNVIPLAA